MFNCIHRKLHVASSATRNRNVLSKSEPTVLHNLHTRTSSLLEFHFRHLLVLSVTTALRPNRTRKASSRASSDIRVVRLFLSAFFGLSPDFLVVSFSVVPERITGVSNSSREDGMPLTCKACRLRLERDHWHWDQSTDLGYPEESVENASQI